MQWAILTGKLKKQQYDSKDAILLASYFKNKTDWLKDPLHISSVIMKLEMWIERAKIWRNREPTPQKEKGGIAKLRR